MHQNNFQIILLCLTQATVQCKRKIEKCVKRIKFKVTDNDKMSNKYEKQSENSCKRQFMLQLEFYYYKTKKMP